MLSVVEAPADTEVEAKPAWIYAHQTRKGMAVYRSVLVSTIDYPKVWDLISNTGVALVSLEVTDDSDMVGAQGVLEIYER